LLPSLTGKGRQRKNVVYIEYYEGGMTPDYLEFDSSHRNRKRNQMQLIRMGDTVGVRYDIKSQQDDFEIYNVATDPKETNNLSSHSNTKDLQKRLKEKALQMRRPDTSARRPYDNELIAASPTGPTKAGLKWEAYKGNFPWIADVTTLQPCKTGSASFPQNKAIKGMENGLLLFEGYFHIPRDGKYTFYLSTGAGALLRIHEATVIDADYGYAGGTERAGEIRLKAGPHPFKLYFSVKKGMTPMLSLQWQGPDLLKQVIPATIYCHE
jgi:hypothetical protein